MSYLFNLSSTLRRSPVAAVAVEVPVVAVVVEVPVVEAPAVLEPEPVAAEVLVEEVTPAASEEQCASPLAPASTASSHTESSS